MKRHLVWLLIGAVACGSSDTSTAPNNSGPPPNPPGNNPTPTASMASVTISSYSFSPGSVTIKVGGTVTWTNNDAVAHTSTSDDGTSWNSGQLAQGGSDGYGGTTAGGSYSHMFAAAGTYSYHCANHTYMTGSVTVTP